MKHNFKRFLCLTLAFVMVFGLFPANVFATGEETVVVDEIIDTEAELKEALVAGGEVVLGGDIHIAEMITIPADVEVELNLNGKTLSYSTAVAGVALLTNKGNLTLIGEGSVAYTYTGAVDTTKAANAIRNEGKLTIDGPDVTNTTTANGQIGYAVDCYSGSELIVKSGSVTATDSYYYDGIRLFCNSETNAVAVTVEGGSVSSIWMQNPSDGTSGANTKDVAGSVTISGGVVDALYLEPSTKFAASVTGGNIGKVAYNQTAEGRDVTGFITGGTIASVVDGMIADGYELGEDGKVVEELPDYVAYIKEQGYETLAAAVAAAESGATITLMSGNHEMCVFQNKELTFVGENKENTTVTDYVAKGSQMHGVKVHFEDLTVNGATENYYGLFHSAEVTYKNCNINGLRFLYAPEVSFESCAFNAEGVEHSFWTYGASNITVTNCTFTYTDRAVNCYSESGASHETDIAFTGCTFTYAGTAAAPEGAVEINSGSSKSIDLTMDDCTAPEKGAMWFNSQWDSTKGANTTVEVDGEYVWKPLKGTGTVEDPILINDLADLILFRDTVNTYTQDGSNQFKGKYVKLTADIDLAGINWTPIGTNSVGDHAAFLGTFDGGDHTISNLYINADGDHLGFFARVGSYAEDCTPTVKNLKFYNVDVSSNITYHWTTGHGDYVGGVIANAGGNSVVSNIKVTGDVYIDGCGYVGGIVGHGYPDLDNCHVNANDGSYVKAGYWCAGGIIGYAGEGGTPITNCSVSGLDIWSAYGAAAAVAGLLQDGNKVENVSASNVEITSDSDYCMGYIAGNGECSTMTNVTVENVTATAKGEPITATDAVASIGDKLYFDLDSAVNAGGEIKLLRNVVLTDTLTISAGKEVVLDLNGKTISQEKNCTASYEMIANNGKLTITGDGKISFTDTGAGDPNAGWGAYTIRNSGTLIVENGTIENLSAQNQAGKPFAHTTLAIFQYSGSTTINGGTISTPNYRSVRLWSGDMTINGGTFDGQVWVHCVNDTSKLTIDGGVFSPNGNDGSSVFVNNNGKKAELTITDGYFETKIGADSPSTLEGSKIVGGTFTEAAVNGTNAALLGERMEFVKGENGSYGVVKGSLKVSTKGELDAALAAAKEGDTILLTADIDYGTDQLKVEKPITLDLGGKTLTTRWAYGGMSVKNNPTIKNGTIVHASNTAAIKVWNAAAFEDLTIDVQGKGDANKTIGGIVLQSGTTTRVDSIKNVTIKGDALTNGIETYNCGDAAQDVIGSMENVTIDAQGTGMLISAPCGTATNCSIKGGVNGIELWIKGTYSASLTLEDSKVEGGVYAHDEFSSNPSVVNNGTLSLTVDEDTTGVKVADVTLTLARAENVEGVVKEVKEAAQAKVNDTYYMTIEAAIKAAQPGNTVTILAGDYTTDVSVNKAITVVGETDADGNNLVNITGKLNITADGATVKNLNVNNGSSSAGYINAKDVLVEGCTVVGGNGFRYCYTTGTVTFKDSTITGSTYGIHFDGSAGGNIVIDNCVITGWTSFAKTIKKVTMTDTTFAEGNYNYVRFYQEEVEITGCTFNEEMAVDLAVDGAKLTVTNSTVENGTVEGLFEGDDIVNSTITVDGVKLSYVAQIGDTYYATLEEALADVTDWTTIKLVADATMDYNAREAYGRDTTTDIIIDGQGFTLTLNQKDSDWSSIGMKNAEGKLTLKNMTIEKVGYGDTNGAWNTHAINFTCAVELENVAVNQGIAVSKNANLKNVTITEANGYYGLWINGNGQTVTVEGGSINATNGGRGIKIADQYIEAPASVTLSVTGTKFNTAKKAAVLVSSKAGADITASNVDITNVAEDSVNFVWVDEDWAAYFGKVSVEGGSVAQESVESFNAVVMDGNKIVGYYKTLIKAVEAANAGETIVLLAPVVVAAGETLTLDKAVTITYTSDVAGEAMFTNNGTMVVDGATIVYTYTGAADSAYTKGNYTISNNGTLTVKSGTIENATASMKHAFYTIQNGGNGTVVIDGGKIINTNNYAIRQFASGSQTNSVTINDGEVIGTRAVWMQAAGSNAANAPTISLTVNGGMLVGTGETGYKLAVYSYNYGDSVENVSIIVNDGVIDGDIALSGGKNKTVAETVTITGGTITYVYSYAADEVAGKTINVSGGTFANPVAEVYCAEGYIPTKNADGTYGVKVGQFVAEINGTKYETLAEAIYAAQPDDTITFLTDITENVTVSKNLTIDGADKNYTGTMTIDDLNLTVTVQNVNFVEGSIVEASGNEGYLTVKNCDFDGNKAIGYAITVRGGDKLTIENVTAKNYNTGMVYIPHPVATISVKNVTIDSVAAAFNITYSGNGTFENVKLTNATYGLHMPNYGDRTFTLIGCEFNCANPIYVPKKSTATVTFEIVGDKNVFVSDTLYESSYTKLVLTKDAVLTASEIYDIAANVTTNADEGYEVVYENGAYKVVKAADPVAEVNGTKYDTLAKAITAAQPGDTITFLADITEDVTVSKKLTIDGAGKTYTGKMTLKADTTIKNVNFDGKGYNGYAVETRGADYLTIEDCTAVNYGYGFVQLASGTALTTVKNVTVSNMNYGVKVDYSNAVVLENVDITANVAAVLNSNYGGKEIIIKNSKLSILGTWERNSTIQTTYVFEGANSIDEFIIEPALDNFKLASGATLTAPEGINVVSGVKDYKVKYEEGTYKLVKAAIAKIGTVEYSSLQEAVDAAKAGQTIKLICDAEGPGVVIDKNLTINLNGKTYSITEGVGSAGTETNGFQILKGTKVTIQSGTLKVADEAASKIAILVQNYGDLTVYNATLDGTNLDKSSTVSYTLSLNSGYTQVVGTSKIIANDRNLEGDYAIDLYDYSSAGYELPYLTIKTVVKVQGKINAAVKVSSTEYAATLQQAVNKAGSGVTLKLLRDTEGAGVIIDKEITIDFGGFTYTLTEGVGSTGTESNGFQILKGNKVQLRNGTIKVADSAAGKFYILIQNYADLTTKNITLDGTNLDKWSKHEDQVTNGDSYVVSNNSGKVNIGSETKIITNDDGSKAWAFDVCDKSAWGYELPVVTAAKNVTINGIKITDTAATESKIEAAVKNGTNYYATLPQAVEAAQDGSGAFVLMRDLTGPGVVIDKKLILDFGNHTYTLTEGVGSTGTESNGFQILAGNTVTLRNGTLKVADSAADKFYILIQNYADLTVQGMTLDGTNLDKWSKTDGDSYTLSNNSGNVLIKNSTIIANNDGDKAFAFDACKFADYESPVVTVVTSTIQGNIEAAAKIINVYYGDLQQAIDAAASGKTVTLMKDIKLGWNDAVTTSEGYAVLVKVEGKDLTLDMNGKTISVDHQSTTDRIYAVVYAADGVNLKVTGEGGIDVNANADAPKVAYMFWKRGTTGSLTIENGTYHMNNSEDSMVYTNGSDIVNVKGGTWTLDAVGTRVNGFPCIFNTQGNSVKNINVSGGTFNADVNHQYWAHEVDIDKTLALKDNGDGTWTVVPAAVYVEEMNSGYTRIVGHTSLVEAVAHAKDGATVTLLSDIDLSKEPTVLLDGEYNAYFKVEGKSITIDLNGKTISGEYADTSTMLVGVFATDNGGHMTVTGNGTVDVTATGTVYSLFCNYEPGCSIVIENGTYTLDKAYDSLLYSGCGASENEGITVNDGTFTLGNVGTGENGKPWIGNILGQNNGYTVFNGGTYNNDFVHQFWANEVFVPETKALKANGDGTWTIVDAEVYVIERGTSTGSYDRKVGYATIGDGIKAVKNGGTVVLVKDVTVEKSVAFTGNRNVSIDLNGHTLSSAKAHIITSYYSNTTITIIDSVGGGKVLTTGGGKHGFVNQSALVIDGAEISSDKGGNAIVAQTDKSAVTIQNDAVINGKIIIKAGTLTITGGTFNDNVDVAENAKAEISAGYFKYPVKAEWCAEGFVPTGLLENGYYSVVSDPSIGKEAKIGETYYETLQAAIEAAKNGETIVVVNDIAVDSTAIIANSSNYATIYNIAEKAITIDLNGKTIDVTVNAGDVAEYNSGILLGVFCVDTNGGLKLTGNGTVTANLVDGPEDPVESKLYSLLVAYGEGSKLTVESGTYHANSVNSSLVYSQYDEVVTINGGTYTLGNLGGGANGSPWIFNAKGRNEQNVLVNGGSFGAAVNDQYWVFEVQMPRELALKYNEETGLWDTVPAVAYVNNQEWSSKWYTNEVGYATIEEAMAALDPIRSKTSGKNTYYSAPEVVTILNNGAQTEIVETNDVATLDSALASGANVSMTENMTVSASATTANSGYGATGVVVNGGTFNGNGKTLEVTGANGGWACAVNPKSGVIQNVTIKGAFRGIFMSGANGDVYINDVVLEDVVYTFNSDAGSKDYGVYISNTTLNGWTSFSDCHKEVVFTKCNFGEGSGYAFCRPYNASVFENCVFEEGFRFDTAQTSQIVFKNCYYGDTLITAENAASLCKGETVFFFNGLNGITIE